MSDGISAWYDDMDEEDAWVSSLSKGNRKIWEGLVEEYLKAQSCQKSLLTSAKFLGINALRGDITFDQMKEEMIGLQEQYKTYVTEVYKKIKDFSKKNKKYGGGDKPEFRPHWKEMW